MYNLFEVTTAEETCLHLIQLLLTTTMNDKVEASIIEVFRYCFAHTPGTGNDCESIAIQGISLNCISVEKIHVKNVVEGSQW